MMLKIQDALRAVYYLVSLPTLSLRERGAALGAVLEAVLNRTPGSRSNPVGIPIGEGELTLDVSHWPDWRVFRGVFIEGTYAADYRDKVVVDIGAHRGIFSAYALREGCAALLAYEPEPHNASFLQRNIESFAKDGQEALLFREAVGAEPGKAKLFVYDQSWSHSSVARRDKAFVEALEVDQVDLETVLARAVSLAGDHRRIILKVDVEGAEYDILQGAPQQTLEKVDELFVETHDYASGKVDPLVQHLAEAGLVPSPHYAHDAGVHELHHFARQSSRAAADA